MTSIGQAGGVRPPIDPNPDPTVVAPAPPDSSEPAASVAARGAASPGRMAAVASLSASTTANPTAADVQAAARAVPRTWDAETERSYKAILTHLDGAVYDRETRYILDTLEQSTPDRFMAIMDRLRQTPWKKNRNLLHKLMRKGIQDERTFITRFAQVAAKQLGLGLHPAFAQGMRKPATERAVADAAEEILDFFECAKRQDIGPDMDVFGEDLKKAAMVPLILLGGFDMHIG